MQYDDVRDPGRRSRSAHRQEDAGGHGASRSEAGPPPLGPAWRAFTDNVRAHVSSIFVPPTQRPAAAQSTPPQSAKCAAYASAASAPKAPAPFPAEQSAWLRDAVAESIAASLEAFGSRMGTEILEVRGDVESVTSAAAGMADTLDRHQHMLSATDSRVADAEAAAAAAQRSVDALSARVERLAASGRGPAGEEGRRLARLGGLGWDTPAADLEARAVDVLTAAGISHQSYGPVAAAVGRSGKGSAAETVFEIHAALEAARVAVRALKRSYSQTRLVWLEVAKTRAENAPVRVMHRVADLLAELERSRQDCLPVRRDAASRGVTVGDMRIAYVAGDKIVWTPAGLARYSASDRSDADSIAAAS